MGQNTTQNNEEALLPKIVYAGVINLVGIYNKEPLKCYLQSFNKPAWFNEDEGLLIKKLGIDHKSDSTIFSSPNEEQVKLWIAGAQAVMHQLKQFIGDSLTCQVCNTETDSAQHLCIFCQANQVEKAPYCKNCGYITLWCADSYECQNCRHAE